MLSAILVHECIWAAFKRNRNANDQGELANNWVWKSPAAPWKSLTQTQQSEAQLNVVVKDGEEIGATILYSQKTPTEIRRQTKTRSSPQW